MEVGKSASEGLQAMNAMSEGDFKAFLGIAFQSLVDSKTTDAKEAKLPASTLSHVWPFCSQSGCSLLGKQASVCGHRVGRIGGCQARRQRKRADVGSWRCSALRSLASTCRSTLEEGKLADDRIKLFVAMYERTKATLRNQLAATS